MKNIMNLGNVKFFLFIIILFSLIPFVISQNVGINGISHNVFENKAEIEWTTNVPADSKVYYGKNDFSNSENSSALSFTHLITLLNLQPNTNYQYYIESCNGDGDCAVSGEIEFTTTEEPEETDPEETTEGETDDETTEDDPDEEPQYPDEHFLFILHNGDAVPDLYNRNLIDLTVETSAYSYVRIFVNGNNVRNRNYFDSNSHTFNDIELNEGNNNINVISELDDETISIDFTIDVNTVPPNVNLNKPLQEFVGNILTQNSFSIEGSTDKFVYLDLFYSKGNVPVYLVETKEIDEGNFQETISLNDDDGRYNILLVFRDLYGNKVEFEAQTYLDTKPNELTITRPFSSEVSSYVDSYRIEGRTKPNADIVVYVNDNNSSSSAWRASVLSLFRAGADAITGSHDHYHTVADEEGYFTMDIRLSKKYYIDNYQGQGYTPQTGFGHEYETSFTNFPAWKNNVKVVSTDLGNREMIEDFIITLTTCDFGGYWNVQLEPITPSKINPLYVNEGVATLSFNYKLEWQGPGEIAEIIGDPLITVDPDFQSTLAPDHEVSDEFNLAQKLLPRDRLINNFNDRTNTGTVTIRLNRYDLDSLEFEDDFNFLYAIVRMEIRFKYENMHGHGSSTDNLYSQGYQPVCINIKVLIDDTFVSPFRIPTLLNKTKNALETVSNYIDPVVTWTREARRYTSYGAFAMNAAYYVTAIRYRRNCLPFIRTNFVPRNSAEGGRIVLRGDCEELKEGDDETKYHQCKQCWDSIITMNYLNKRNRLISDRVFCPSVPSVQEYNRRIRHGMNYFFLDLPDGDISELKEIADKDNTLYLDQQRDLLVSTINRCQNITEIYFSNNTEDLFQKELCRLQYEFEWKTACLFTRDLFNRSFETRNQTMGSLDILSDVMEKFCFKQHTIDNSMITVNNRQQCIDACHPDFTQNFNSESLECEPRDASDFSQIYSFRGFSGTGMPCYYLLNPPGLPEGIYYAQFDANDVCITDPNTGVCKVENGAILIDPVNLRLELRPHAALTNFNQDDLPGRGSVTQFITDIAARDREGRNVTQFEQSRDEAVFYNRFGLGDYAFAHTNQYIMEPPRTIASSINCACITGFEAHLGKYKQFIDFGKACLEEVMFDPNSTATTCQRVFAMRLCDLIYESIRCIGKYSSQKIYFGTERPEEAGGVGNLFAAMSQAGNDVSLNLRQRYGQSNAFENIFSEKAILNAVCMGAFFGDFDAEFDTLFAATEEMVVIDPLIMVYPAHREYMSYSPLTGLATFIYRMGVVIVAGADMQYFVYLRCSDAMCGHEPCDCMLLGEERTYRQTGIQGSLRRGETLHRDFITEVTQPLRYDTVLIRYTYRNQYGDTVEGFKEFPIRDIGGPPPLHCEFDLLLGQFRCNMELGDHSYASFGPTWPRMHGVTTGEATYRIGDKVLVDGEIVKRDKDDDEFDYTGESDNKKHVFLRYLIRDDRNSVVLNREHRIDDEGRILLYDLFDSLNVRVNRDWFTGAQGQSQTNRGITAQVGGLIENDVGITVQGTQNDLKISIVSHAEIRDAQGNVIQSGSSMPYDIRGFSFSVISGNNIANINVFGMPNPQTSQSGYFLATIELTRSESLSRRFYLELSLHHPSDNNPAVSENQPIYNQREERTILEFNAVAQDSSNMCPEFMRYLMIGEQSCICYGNECPNKTSPNHKYCFYGCRTEPACNAVRMVGASGLTDPQNKNSTKALLKVHQNSPCFCDPRKEFHEPDYLGGDEMYCYIYDNEDGSYVFKLGDSSVFDSDWDQGRIVRYKDGMNILMHKDVVLDVPVVPVDPVVDEPSFTIVIDAGHGGEYPGATAEYDGEEYFEKDLNLDVALKLKTELEKDSRFDVRMVRETDIHVSNGKRIQDANDIEAYAFISIHHNNHENKNANGTETWYDDQNGHSNSKTLAEKLQKALVDELKLYNRNIKDNNKDQPGNLIVLKNAKVPAALVEIGFMSNDEELKKLIDDGFQQRAAQAIADGLNNYITSQFET